MLLAVWFAEIGEREPIHHPGAAHGDSARRRIRYRREVEGYWLAKRRTRLFGHCGGIKIGSPPPFGGGVQQEVGLGHFFQRYHS